MAFTLVGSGTVPNGQETDVSRLPGNLVFKNTGLNRVEQGRKVFKFISGTSWPCDIRKSIYLCVPWFAYLENGYNNDNAPHLHCYPSLWITVLRAMAQIRVAVVGEARDGESSLEL